MFVMTKAGVVAEDVKTTLNPCSIYVAEVATLELA
jgi:hypothetical protein